MIDLASLSTEDLRRLQRQISSELRGREVPESPLAQIADLERRFGPITVDLHNEDE
jgi:hypothetical protein